MNERRKERRVGSYLLVLELGEEMRIEVGRLGPVQFKKGIYVYAGSAKNGLLPRLKRHFSSEKKVHWHIDYLLQEGSALYAFIFEKGPTECELNRSIDNLPGSAPIPGFGCSDCNCPTHLHWIDPKSLGRMQKAFPDAARLSAMDFQ